MRTQSVDTHPAAEKVLIDLIRKAPISKRFQLVRSSTASLLTANIRDILRLHPDATPGEITEIFFSHPGQNNLQRSTSSLIKKLKNKSDWLFQEPDILLILTSLAETFTQLQIDYYIGGSIASSVYGMQQLAQDIDIIAFLHPLQARAMMTQFQTSYLIDELEVYQAIEKNTSFSMVHLGTLLKVDVILPPNNQFEQQVAHHRQWHILKQNTDPFPLSSPEDIVLIKLLHHGKATIFPDDQWNDILGVLKVQAHHLNLTYMETLANDLGITHLLQQACIDAGLKE